MYKNYSYKVNGKIRIIGGKWRGRQIGVIGHLKVRPTPNRVRETLFNWLEGTVKNSKCLDCFSGTGALGLEALSRYATSTTFLEIQKSIIIQLTKNLLTLKAQNGYIIHTNALKFLSQEGKSHRLVFVDPPFHANLIEHTLALLESNAWLQDESLIYVESSAEYTRPKVPINWFLYREMIAGRVASRLYNRIKNI
ncbi:16S rRNA (guanine(966)-N(2))-methyltransferase RsmD [Candidatus Erwinia haradaeae]|uniref:Ribosomal RNA small subunit methyltransferase D n=1 Tax=Candidatus Erwinia haradaeae TaxID=1922217 RepID=A0A451D1T6_9GAMM|nr:16S rRNA (guanine(966)-N(2))-methyltransferase RsmD [Candidatus Erwinia haradaeae]VFP79590.1 Ribosomal RNA small subunit methyltransferase D [Candidatus Erwinia haradaeae]